MRPKLRDTSAPASLKEFTVPTAEEARSIPVIWGTVLVDQPNVIWYGDLQTVKLTKRVRTGLFSSDRLTLGFRYSIGMHFAMCHGPVDALTELRTDNKVAFTGNITDPTGLGNDFTVDARTIYGGDAEEQLEQGGEGGIYAACTFYKGTGTQLANSYMENILATEIPGYREICHVVWKGPSSGNVVYNYDLGNPTIVFTREPFLSGYIGTNPNLKPFSFVIKRLPNLLSGGSDTFYNINGDANPADCLMELITSDRFGMGLSSTLIDTDAFKDVQETCYEEGLGFSAIWDSPKKVSEIIDEILKYIDGVIYVDLTTGLLTIALARADYDINTIPSFNEDNVSEIGSYSRGSWDETTNEVQLSYVDRTNNFKSKIAVAQDLANVRIQNSPVAVNTSYVGISNPTTASTIAYRDLRVLATPLAKITLRLNRLGASIRPASVFKLTWPEYELENKVFRATRVRYGELQNGLIEIDAVEDIFSISSSIYGSPASSEWVNPVLPPTTVVEFQIQEAPYLFSEESARIKVFAAKPDNGQLSFNTLTSVNSMSGTYFQVDSGDSFTPTGTLDSNYTAITNDVDTVNDLVITPTTPSMMTFLQNFSADTIKTGQNLFLITDGSVEELCAFESVTYNSGTGKYTLENIWRGLGDTVPQNWTAGARLWFFTYGEGFPSQTYTAGNTVYTKIQSVALGGSSTLSSAESVAIVRRATKPYPPGKFQINGSTSTVNISAGSNIVVAWEPRNRKTQGEIVTKQFDTGIVAESGTEYYIKFFNASNTLLRTVGPLTTTTYTYLNADQVADNSSVEPLVVTVQLYSVRDGLSSFQAQQRTLIRPTGSAPAPPSYSPGADAYDPPPPDNAANLSGIPICTNTPTDGQALVYSSADGCWKPQAVSVTLGGDVTGPSGANTVVKIQNRAVASTAPTDGQVLTWDSGTTQWRPESAANASIVRSVYKNTAASFTTTATWTDITDMSLTVTAGSVTSLYTTFTCQVVGTSANHEHIAFRFMLDGIETSETWLRQRDVFPTNSDRQVITLHTAFETIPSGSHTVKVQWQDNSSGLDVTFRERRLTLFLGASTWNDSFVPTDVTNCEYWFKADALTGLVDDDPVLQLTDSTSNARHFTQATSGQRGLYKTNQLNSKPSVRFAAASSRHYTGPNFMTGFTAGEIFYVVKATSDPAAGALNGGLELMGSDIQAIHYPYTDSVVYLSFGSTARKNLGNPTPSLTSYHVLNMTSASGYWQAKINNAEIYSTTTNTVGFTSAPKIAASNSGAYFDGDICEIIIYSRQLDAAEKNAVYLYLKTKYAL